MGRSKTKANQGELGIFTHIPAYSGMLRHNQVSSGIIQAYSGIFRTLYNSGMFKTLACPGIFRKQNIHCVKTVRIRSYSGPHFSRIFPHSDYVSLRIQSECGKMQEKCGPEILQTRTLFTL